VIPARRTFFMTAFADLAEIAATMLPGAQTFVGVRADVSVRARWCFLMGPE
jgi:hypothetical protein